MAITTQGPSPAPTITCSVFGGQCTKSHWRKGRSWPSTTRSASPEMTRNASASVSQWYSEFGSPGSSTASWTPSIGKSVSASHSVLPVNATDCRPGRAHQRASRAFSTNQPLPPATRPCSVRSSGASGTTERPDRQRDDVGGGGDRMRWARVVEPTTDVHGAWGTEHRCEGQRQRSGAQGISAAPDVQRRRSSEARACGSRSLRLAGDQNAAGSVARNLSVERVLADGKRAAREDRRRGSWGRRADLDRVRVPRLEGVRQATGLAP